MRNALKVCGCFFDVGVYCKMKDSFYIEFFSLCMKERDDRKTSFIITTHEDCFIVCCKYFLKITIKISGFKKIKPLLVSNCFYSNGGFESESEDDVSSCINMNFDEQNTNYFCFCCQKIILNSFSERLHYITHLDFLVKRKNMKFRFCCCLFDHYVFEY